MTGLMMFVHAVVCVLLVTVILMQSGRGGGLTESFSSAESMFGAQTNEFMIKATTILASLFLVTCLGLAVLSSKTGKSIMPSKVATQAPTIPPVPSAPAVPAAPAAPSAPAAEAPAVPAPPAAQ